MTIEKHQSRVIKGRVTGSWHKLENENGDPELYAIGDFPVNTDVFRINEYITSSVGKRVDIEIINESGQDLKLKRGQVIAEIQLIEHASEKEEEIEVYSEGTPIVDVKDNEELSEKEQTRLQDILSNYHRQIEDKSVSKCGINYEHEIHLTDNIPVTCRPRLLPRHYEADINGMIDKLLKEGVLSASDSLYASAVVPVIKRDGSIRMCCDFRKLNSKTIPKVFPTPRAEQIFEDLGSGEVFSVMDLKSTYWHIPIKESDKEKTVFITSKGKYHWNVLPYGLTDAAFSLARVMQMVLGEFEFAKSFYDGCLIYGSRSEHLQQIEKVLNKFATLGIHVNFSKCQFMKSEVTFLGHLISKKGIRPTIEKSLQIVNVAPLTNVSELKTFLGMAAYYKKFIPDFAEKATVLYYLLKKDAIFDWDHRCQQAFEKLKSDLQSTRLLVHPDYNRPFVLVTDASQKALGFVLMQQTQDDDVMQPVRFGGRPLTPAETRYSVTDQELLGLYFAVKKCEYYLVGNQFVCYTDHKPLVHLKAFKDIIHKRFRWIQYLESMNTNVRYIEGKNNIISDFISRNVINEEDRWEVIVNSVDLGDLVSYKPEELRIKQYNDKVIMEVINNINKGQKLSPKYKKYTNRLCMEEGLLMYMHHGSRKLVVPEELKDEVLDLGHAQVFSGHQGIFKTHRRILELCWWPELYHDVKAKIKKCKVCAMCRQDNRKKSRLGKRKFPRKPLEFVSIDFVVNLDKTKNGNIHMLTVVDNFTKFIRVYPVKDRVATTAAQCMYDYSMQFGIPKTIYSDKDPAFQAEFFRCFLNLLGINKKTTTGYNPKANGLCERTNGIVKNMLVKYVNFFGGEWDMWLRELQYAYNSSIHTSTGFSPAELMYGRKLSLPMDIIFARGSGEVLYHSLAEMKKKLEDIYEIVRINMDTRQDVAATYYDKKIQDDVIEDGSEVYVFVPRSSKLDLKWKGPYTIEKEDHPSYLIQMGENKEKWFIRDHLRRIEHGAPMDNLDVPLPRGGGQHGDSSSEDEREDDEEEEREEGVRRRPGNLRQNIRLPERYGPYVTHFMQICV